MADYTHKSLKPDLARGTVSTGYASPGKRTLVEQASAATEVVQQRMTEPAPAADTMHAAAREGIAGPSEALPHRDRIQQLFGHHDVTNIKAHNGGPAAEASRQMGAQAYATGDHVAFRSSPDLHTAAHEAAHVVQQRAGIQLKGGVGQTGDAYERHADAVADAVVAGRPAGGLLDEMAPHGASAEAPVQRQIQLHPEEPTADTKQKNGGHEKQGEHHLNVDALSEEEIRDIVFLRDGKGGKSAGMERYDANVKPPRARDPKPGKPTEDKKYDVETWEHAKHRLEVLMVQQESKEEVEPKYHVGRSSTKESRAERREADERVTKAKERLEEKENTKGHHRIGAAKREMRHADANQKDVYGKTKDPLGEEREKHEAEKESVANEKREAVEKVKGAREAYEAALKRLETPAAGKDAAAQNEHAKAEAAKARAELKEALDHAQKIGASTTSLGKAYDTLKEHTELRGDLYNKAATTGDKEIYGEHHDGVEGFGGSTREGERHLVSARGDAKANLSVGSDGVHAEASAGGKAVLAEAKEQWKWEMPGHFMGEAVNAKLFFQVSGMLGAEAHARLKANVGKQNPKEPKMDMNAISAGVDGFAGLKASVGVGAAFEWQKAGAEVYKSKVDNAGKVMLDLITATNPPLGFILRTMNGDAAAAKLMQGLMSWGKAGTVPLASIEASIEGSAGIGGVAQASIGMRGGKFEFQTKANATFGLGLGAEVRVALDVVEGPKFALITLGELRPIAIKYVEDQVKAGLDAGSHFIEDITTAVSDWWHAKDKAHELVQHKVPEVLPAAKNSGLIDNLFGWYCAEEDQHAIVQVLQTMSNRGQLGSLTPELKLKIMMKLDGAQHRQAGSIIGNKPWK